MTHQVTVDPAGDRLAERITRRKWLREAALFTLADSHSLFVASAMANEAVASTAIEHPEWDMDEVRTREEWAASD